jgi:signal transduction histidine kinase
MATIPMRALADPAHMRLSVLHPAAETRRPLFENLRRIVHSHALATDALMAVGLLALCTGWLVWTHSFDWAKASVQLAVIAPLVWRRSNPTAVFCIISLIALAQWALGYKLIGDASLLIALYTVAVHEHRNRAFLATALMEVGSVMAATRWHPAGTVPRSFLFLTATVVAALFAGLTVRSGSEYMGWLAERAERLEIERDQQASLGAAAERARIAREMHDIVAHSLSVVITLADAASAVGQSDPTSANEAMEQVSAVGRKALTDMRTLIGVLRADLTEADLAPAPTLDQIDDLFDRIRATGLNVCVERRGEPFSLSAATSLSLYRIVQEALTNTLKHANAANVIVVLLYDSPFVYLDVADDGSGLDAHASARHSGLQDDGIQGHGIQGHGIQGMRERARLHEGTLEAGPRESGGWVVSATIRETNHT